MSLISTKIRQKYQQLARCLFNRRSDCASLIAAAIISNGILAAPQFATAQPGLVNNAPVAPFLNGVFPDVAPGAESFDGSGAWSTRNYFPGVTFIEPLRIIEHPTQNQLLIVGKDGKGHLITHAEGASDKKEYFNIQPIMHGNPGVGEGGISDFAFHPEFGDRGSDNTAYVYISYWWSPVNSGTFSDDNGIDGYNRLSRFEVVRGKVDLSTELILINQYDREFWHIAMNLEFGPDGFLYISVGDESPTDCCDKRDTTQRLDGGLWGGILRIDVDNDPTRSHAIRRQPRHPAVDPTSKGSQWPESFTQGYSIPNDNPFLSPDGSLLEEFYSLGLRHTWTMSFDEVTGQLWATDVGHFFREEINLVEKGDNYQWPFFEGTRIGPVRGETTIGNSKPPALEYDHDIGRSIIGAGVYRGDIYPDLVGKYVYSDFTSGRLWTATQSVNGLVAERIGDVSSGWGNGVVSYLLDSKGQILLAKTAGGQKASVIQTLVRESASSSTNSAPGFLSQTGAFDDLRSLTPASGCIPYSVNVPFWSDGAEKYRWVCVPNDGTHNTTGELVEFSENGNWNFPVGTVFIKHFDMPAVAGDPASIFRLETRFLVHGDQGYYGLSYRWSEDGTDAALVGASGEERAFVQQTTSGAVDRIWEYPSRNQCLECHLPVAGGPLSANTRQLNRNHVYATTGVESNQLETFNFLGMLSPALDADVITNAITSTPSNDPTATLETRARSYLDANCSSCHRPGGVRAGFDARLITPLEDQGLINGELHEVYDIEGEVVISPGNLEQSIVFHRANRTGELAMPPLGKSTVDVAGMALLQEWILSLSDSPAQSDGGNANGNTVPIGQANGVGSSSGGGAAWLLALAALFSFTHRYRLITHRQ